MESFKDWLKSKTSARSLFGPSSLFQAGVSGFYSGVASGLSGSGGQMAAAANGSVVQGIPNWLLGIGIIYLAMRK